MTLFFMPYFCLNLKCVWSLLWRTFATMDNLT